MVSNKKCKEKLLKNLTTIALLIFSLEFLYSYNTQKMRFLNPRMNENIIKIFISAHKDFNNCRLNPVYNIVADEKSQLNENYNLNVIYANEGKLFNKKKSYGEMAKIYYIYLLYQNETLSSKYIGFCHYRRYFSFGDNIPDLDYIFSNYDAILLKKINIHVTVRENYCQFHICSNYDQLLEIINETKPEYYEAALKVSNNTRMYFCNIFVMKKEDFFEYCKFMFDVLFEFDKRNNFTSDKEVLNYTKKIFYTNINESYYQSRLDGFLAERISNIFYFKNFKKIKSF